MTYLFSDQMAMAGNLRELGKALFQPFRTHVKEYGKYQSNILLSELVSNAQPSKDLIDELRNISISVPKLVQSFAEASKQCCDLTEGNKGLSNSG